MSKTRIINDAELALIREDKKTMTYPELSKKYGYSTSTLKGYCAAKGTKAIPLDLRPKGYKSDIFNWDFECY